MGQQTLLLIDDPASGAAALALVDGPAREAGLEPRLCEGEAGVIHCLGELLAAGQESAVVVFGPHLDRPLATARQVFRLAPLVQMVFLADGDRAGRLKRELALAPMIGTHWSLAAPEPESLNRLLRDAARSVSQRRQLRTTLDRARLRLASPPPTDSPDFRRLVLSDRYLASILAHARDAILSVEDEGRILTWNRAAEGLFGYAEAEALGRPLVLLAADHAGAEVITDLLRQGLDGSPTGRRELVCRRKEGSTVDVELTLAPVLDEAGRPLGRSAIVRDVSDRKRAEEAARQQREWLRVTLTSIGDAVIATDTAGRVTFLNPVAEGLTGWTQDEAVGRPLAEVFAIINEQTRRPVENPVAHVLREGVVVGLANHTLLIARDGSERPIADSAAPIRDSNGGLLGVVLVFRDVTEERQADRALRASEARKAAVLKTALDCIITIDHLGRVIEFNPAAEQTFGYRREEVLGRELAELIVPLPLREPHRRGLAHYLATGEGPVLGKRLELPAIRANGTEFPVELAITRLPGDGPPLFTAYLRDITDRQETERRRTARLAVTQTLAEAATAEAGVVQTLRSVCETLGWDAGTFWRLDREARVLQCEQVLSAPPGLPTFEAATRRQIFAKGVGLPGRVWEQGRSVWVEDVTREANFPRCRAAVEQGLHGAFACPVLLQGGLLGVVEFFSRSLREPDADLLEMMATIGGQLGQFLERKQAEDQVRRQNAELAEADRRKDEFLAMLAHELRNPLAPLRNALHILSEPEAGPAVLRRATEMMKRQVSNLARLVDDLLDVSRITRGKVELRKERIDLAAALRRAVETSRPLIEAGGHELTVLGPPSPVLLEADPTRLEQVIANLLNNAAKYTDRGGQIWLSAGREGDEAVIRVRDTGVGISTELMPRLFDLFSQAERSLDRSQGGLGIGLALVKRLAELHGGRVTALSEGPGRGSEFTVRLPAIPEAVRTDPVDEPSPPSRTESSFGRRVLVVDDNRDSAESLALVLRAWGHEVHTAHEGRVVLGEVHQLQLDVVVLDIGLPGMNGYEVARQLRQEGPRGLLMVAMTGYGQEEDREKSRQAGFDCHLVKPVDLEALRSVLAGPQPRKE